MDVPTKLRDGHTDAVKAIRGMGDPTERYSVAVEWGSWYYARAEELIAAAGEANVDPDADDDDG